MLEDKQYFHHLGKNRVRHDWATSLSLFISLSCIGEGNGNPLQCSCLENPRDGGAWWAAVYGVAQSRTRLKRFSSSSSSSSVHMWVLLSWFVPPSPSPQALHFMSASPFSTSCLYSRPGNGSSVPFSRIPCVWINIWYWFFTFWLTSFF